MIYKIKDSVDLFLSGNIITAYFMNTRKQMHFKVNEDTVRLLEAYDGITSVQEIAIKVDLEESIVKEFSEYLIRLKIIILIETDYDILSPKSIEQFNRQINYLGEFFETANEALKAQKKIEDTKFIIFGCGAIGGNIAVQLAMAGASNIVLYDYDYIEKSDISRHIYFKAKDIGKLKTDVLEKELLKINSKLDITVINDFMQPKSDAEYYIKNSNFVINTLDEPYIGYTSAKISRICTRLNIPHYIAGGFDAHLASTGELIIPGLTPCVECYASHFKEVLKDWKPKAHPVVERYNEIGGLSSMSLFSSSFAVIEIIKFITQMVDVSESYKTRGELLFKDLSLTYIKLDKDPNCKVCGELVNIK